MKKKLYIYLAFLIFGILLNQTIQAQTDSTIFVILSNFNHMNFMNKIPGETCCNCKSLHSNIENKVYRKAFFLRKEKARNNIKLLYNNHITGRVDSVCNILYRSAKESEFADQNSPLTRQYISKINVLYNLVLVKRHFENAKDSVNYSDYMREKLILLLDERINQLNKKESSYYSYRTQYAKMIKFVSVSTGNDLFTLGGLMGLFKNKMKSRLLLQRNDDRDYTGSMLIEVGTDYFKFPRRRPIKSYQTLLFGFDVYTPYFRDTAIFSKVDTHNVNDRPHASFQYVGWSRKGLSLNDKYRWSLTIKFGKIGGSNGEKFQTILHQDISYSMRPRGWGHQISNGGRVGFSFEGTHESLLPQIGKHIFPYVSERWKIGTYMTCASVGVGVSNKSFKQNNPNYINHRTQQNVSCLIEHLYLNLNYHVSYVEHNTMLEGYGVFNTNEKKNDIWTPNSYYVLPYDEVKRVTQVLNFNVSYTARYFTIFYNIYSFSPETNKGDIGIKKYPEDTENMNIKNRWHHFAVFGCTFNIVD